MLKILFDCAIKVEIKLAINLIYLCNNKKKINQLKVELYFFKNKMNKKQKIAISSSFSFCPYL